MVYAMDTLRFFYYGSLWFMLWLYTMIVLCVFLFLCCLLLPKEAIFYKPTSLQRETITVYKSQKEEHLLQVLRSKTTPAATVPGTFFGLLSERTFGDPLSQVKEKQQNQHTSSLFPRKSKKKQQNQLPCYFLRNLKKTSQNTLVFPSFPLPRHSFGSGISIFRSKRPGRKSAGSKVSGPPLAAGIWWVC